MEQKGECKKELRRVCESCKRSDVKKLLNWLGQEVLANPDFSTKQTDVFTKIVAPGQESTDSDELKDARNLVRDARTYLRKFYRKVPNPSNIWITIPNKYKQENPFADGAYTLQFRPERPTVYFSPASEVTLGPAEKFWKRMINAVDAQKGLLVYSDEQPERGEQADTKGLYSGSGEVAAAFLIGSRTAHLKSVIDTWRSSKVSYETLRQDPSWLVILGSSLSNGAVRGFRSDTRWADMQTFHFEEEKDADGVAQGVIQQGKFNEQPMQQWRYKHLSSRDHEDYALISYFHDEDHKQVLIAFQGISTLGTWAAARFLCGDRTVQDLMKKYPALAADPMPSFEVLLKVKITDYRPDDPEIVDCVPQS